MRVQFSGGFFSKPEEVKPKPTHSRPQASQATQSKPDTFQPSKKPVTVQTKPIEPKEPEPKPKPKVELPDPNWQFNTDSDDSDSDNNSYGSDSD